MKWFKSVIDEGIVLRALRMILPPFHPWKYKWIKWRYGPQRNHAWYSVDGEN